MNKLENIQKQSFVSLFIHLRLYQIFFSYYGMKFVLSIVLKIWINNSSPTESWAYVRSRQLFVQQVATEGGTFTASASLIRQIYSSATSHLLSVARNKIKSLSVIDVFAAPDLPIWARQKMAFSSPKFPLKNIGQTVSKVIIQKKMNPWRALELTRLFALNALGTQTTFDYGQQQRELITNVLAYQQRAISQQGTSKSDQGKQICQKNKLKSLFQRYLQPTRHLRILKTTKTHFPWGLSVFLTMIF